MASTKKNRSRSRSGARRTSVNDSKTGTEPPKRSVADHSEHPEHPGDSTVRHADQALGVGRASAGKKGFPQGEYDVNRPAKAAGKKQDIKQTLLEQHEAEAGVEVDEVKRLLKERSGRLSASEFSLAVETLPLGAVIEHEGPYRWRVRGPVGGGNRFGHGKTMAEAVEDYVLGTPTHIAANAAADQFSRYPKSVQEEIKERDAKAARALGQDPDSTPEAIARREFEENAKAATKAKTPASNASSSGPEIASAQLEAGRRRGNPQSQDLNPSRAQATSKATSNRKAARRRSGGKARR